MTIKTERLTLVPMGMEFLETTHEYATDAENTRFMTILPNESIEETISFLKGAEAEWKKEAPSFYEFAILLDGKHIGAISIYLNEDRSIGEFGWLLDRNYHGRGYAFEAASALLAHAVDTLGIRHFIAHCDTENAPSRRVMEKLGMTLREEYSGRKNKGSDEERRGYIFGLDIPEPQT